MWDVGCCVELIITRVISNGVYRGKIHSRTRGNITDESNMCADNKLYVLIYFDDVYE